MPNLPTKLIFGTALGEEFLVHNEIQRFFSKKRNAAKRHIRDVERQARKARRGAGATSTSRSKGGNSWLKRHVRDAYVRKSKEDGYASRAAYKLEEIVQKHPEILTPETFVFDVGAAPGSWTQVACSLVNSTPAKVKVIAVDILPLATVPKGSIFAQGDFTEVRVQDLMVSTLDDIVGKEKSQGMASHGGAEHRLGNVRQITILSDMRSNTSGNKALDHARQVELCEHVFSFARRIAGIVHDRDQDQDFKVDVNVVTKMTMGEDFDVFRDQVQSMCKKHWLIKPKSSRQSSSELFVVAKGITVV